MSLSDCEKCWSTPCECGHDYRNWTAERLREQIAMLETVLRGKTPSEAVEREFSLPFGGDFAPFEISFVGAFAQLQRLEAVEGLVVP